MFSLIGNFVLWCLKLFLSIGKTNPVNKEAEISNKIGQQESNISRNIETSTDTKINEVANETDSNLAAISASNSLQQQHSTVTNAISAANN